MKWRSPKANIFNILELLSTTLHIQMMYILLIFNSYSAFNNKSFNFYPEHIKLKIKSDLKN